VERDGGDYGVGEGEGETFKSTSERVERGVHLHVAGDRCLPQLPLAEGKRHLMATD